MKYIFALILIFLSVFKSFSAFDSYSTLYKSKITLNNGNQMTGYYYHFNYDTIPEYSFTNKEFHEFLKIESKHTNDSIEIYAKLQNIRIPHIHDFDSNRFSAVTKTDLCKIAINDIKNVEFISASNCNDSRIFCNIIKELNQSEIRFQLNKVEFIHSVGEPGLPEGAEAAYQHFILGNDSIISKAEIEKLIISLYTPKGDYYEFEVPKYYQLKKELRKREIILITLYETDYFTSNNLLKE